MTSTETMTLAGFKELVARKAKDYLDGGYGTIEEWNATLVHLGLAPMTTKQVVVKHTIQAVVTKNLGVDEDEARGWVERNRRSLFSIYDLDGQIDTSQAEVEVVDLAPGAEGVEPLPNADTEDLKVYRRLVRREAMRLREVFDWCEGGTNAALEELGLPQIGTVRMMVDVALVQRLNIEVEAGDQEEAAEMLAAGELDDRVRAYFNSRARVLSAVPADPSTFLVGDPNPTEWRNANRHTRIAEQGTLCATQSPGGYACTRETGHEGDHIAGHYEEVTAVWPQA